MSEFCIMFFIDICAYTKCKTHNNVSEELVRGKTRTKHIKQILCRYCSEVSVNKRNYNVIKYTLMLDKQDLVFDCNFKKV